MIGFTSAKVGLFVVVGIVSNKWGAEGRLIQQRGVPSRITDSRAKAVYTPRGQQSAWSTRIRDPIISVYNEKEWLSLRRLSRLLRRPVVVDFYASWCSSCDEDVEPHYKMLANHHRGEALFARVDVDKAARFTEEQNITNVPVVQTWNWMDGAFVNLKQVVGPDLTGLNEMLDTYACKVVEAARESEEEDCDDCEEEEDEKAVQPTAITRDRAIRAAAQRSAAALNRASLNGGRTNPNRSNGKTIARTKGNKMPATLKSEKENKKENPTNDDDEDDEEDEDNNVNENENIDEVLVHTLNDANDYKDLIEGARDDNQIVVLDFYASWCAPCKTIAPRFERLAETESENGLVFAKVDVDEFEDLAEEEDVNQLPTFQIMMWKNGKWQKHTIVGANIAKVEKAINVARSGRRRRA